VSSLEHETPLLVIREAPQIVPLLLEDVLNVPVPSFSILEVASAELADVAPVERHADLVVLAQDESGSWLLVLADDDTVATWARRRIDTFHPNPGIEPLVIGPSEFPCVTERDAALAAPELSVLSAIMHRASPRAAEIAALALEAVTEMDEPKSKLYADLILACLPEVTRIALEALMESGKYEYKSDFARKYIALGREEGRAEGREEGREEGRVQGVRDAIFEVLQVRGLTLDVLLRSRIQSEASIDVLRTWLSRAALATSIDGLFGE
jgi:hypothetical protein